jgi:hypothetical protein
MPFDNKDEWQNYAVPVKISDLSFITKTSDGYFARISENGGPYKIVKISKDFKEFTTVAEGDSDLLQMLIRSLVKFIPITIQPVYKKSLSMILWLTKPRPMMR